MTLDFRGFERDSSDDSISDISDNSDMEPEQMSGKR